MSDEVAIARKHPIGRMPHYRKSKVMVVFFAKKFTGSTTCSMGSIQKVIEKGVILKEWNATQRLCDV
jgi:hypothetical protein